MTEEIKTKICLVGDNNVGKTSLIRRFVLDTFDDKYTSTIGTKVTKKEVTVKKENGREISPGESVYVVVNDYKKRIFSEHGGKPDRAFYREIMKRTFEPFDFAFESAIKSKPSRNLLDFFH